MSALAKTLAAMAGLAFALAVATVYAGPILGLEAEGFSRASNNLALLAIALVLVFEDARRGGQPGGADG